jgi:hypothetical protein
MIGYVVSVFDDIIIIIIIIVVVVVVVVHHHHHHHHHRFMKLFFGILHVAGQFQATCTFSNCLGIIVLW